MSLISRASHCSTLQRENSGMFAALRNVQRKGMLCALSRNVLLLSLCQFSPRFGESMFCCIPYVYKAEIVAALTSLSVLKIPSLKIKLIQVRFMV